MDAWWNSFFDDDYIRIWSQVLTEEISAQQALDLWSMLDLSAGCRILDAPCGWGRLSLALARLGANVLGVDQADRQLDFARQHAEGLAPDRLRYLQHDLRSPLDETGFDVACNIFSSFGYGTEEEDVDLFRTLRAAVRIGGRVVVETNHRDFMCAGIGQGKNGSRRLPDGTLFVEESDFDAIAGIVQLRWYWSGPWGAGEKRAQWRCYTPTQIVDLLEQADLHFTGAYKGLSKTPYKAEGPDAGGRLAVVAVREH
ncbi:MAG TPA: class I SAM-dependent methyltransferase [Acidobacteriaceae bacterium]|nr:class I SAM-dependent methyltransferase [Acidobacteriaceae bacterium]